ncbi:MAG: cysteine--tRNA ligase [Elusimicrobiota bacterium]
MMPITLSNTLTGKKEPFIPIRDNEVSMYVCGVTPYDEVHLGHARAYVAFDIIRRHFEHSGFKVRFIQNFTDVDDKIIKRAGELKEAPSKLADRFTADYFAQMEKLNVKKADAYPKVTETIPKIISFIQTLIEKGFAYAVDGDVYYSVRKFSGYGKLSKRNIEDMRSGARVEPGEQKQDPLDFALWKKSKPEEPADVSWDSPWGKGRPGWHIECSVMSTGALGPTIDIHGGGQDLIFPHHENEIAQSEAATGQPFVKYWIHNGFVTINHEKMSKSLGNFFTLREIFEKYNPRVVRYYLLTQHYKGPLDFSDENLRQAKNALEGIDEAYFKLSHVPEPVELPGRLHNLDSEMLSETIGKFKAMLDDDFNTERALAVIHELKKEILQKLGNNDFHWLRKALFTLSFLMQDYLGIPLAEKETVPEEALKMQKEREQARRDKNWKLSDELRAKLEAMGYKIEDSPDGSSKLIGRS